MRSDFSECETNRPDSLGRRHKRFESFKLPDKLLDEFLAKITGAAPAAAGKKTFKTTEWLPRIG